MPEYYVQDTPDLPVIIQLSLDAVDKIGQEVMTGFGRVPRRGAEVGGILLGAVTDGPRPVVRIEGFAPVPIEYRFGPSWLLSDTDELVFAHTLAMASIGENRPVGLVRSNTRPEQSLAPEDIAQIAKHLPQRPLVVLLVQPFVTQPSQAAFYARVEGSFHAGMAPGPQFPFRRRTLERAEEPQSQATPLVRPQKRLELPAEPLTPAVIDSGAPRESNLAAPAAGTETVSAREERRPARMWAPLSFIFLIIGVLVGFQAALAFRSAKPADPYDLRLTVSKSGGNLTVSWDHASDAIRRSRHAMLYIDEGELERPVELGTAELTSGSVVYSPASSRVEFRLQIFPADNASLTQTVAWGK